MANIPTPITHVYTEINEGKFKGVKHFEIDNSIILLQYYQIKLISVKTEILPFQYLNIG